MGSWRSGSKKAGLSGSIETRAFSSEVGTGSREGNASKGSSFRPLPYEFSADRALMRLHRGAKLAVIVDVKPRGIAQAQRSGCAGIRAILAFADALHDNALGTETDGD